MVQKGACSKKEELDKNLLRGKIFENNNELKLFY